MIFKLFQFVIMVLCFAGSANVIIRMPLSYFKLIVSLAIIIFLWILARASAKTKLLKDSGKLLKTICFLSLGFWIFSLLRYLNYVRWPMARAASLSGYTNLLIFHLIFFVLIVASVFMVYEKQEIKNSLSFGKWKNSGFFGKLFFYLLSSSAIFIWAYSFYFMFGKIGMPHLLFFYMLPISLLKAFLTGFGEEFIYRGIIQKESVKVFGKTIGILFQALLYTSFHLRMNTPFFSHTKFIAIVFFLGVIFGIITQKTKGIGWAVVFHSSLDFAIEWQNIIM